MERLDGAAAAPAALRGGVIALGNFDGFHLGHQAVVGRALALARAQGRPALVATFDPHPASWFKPDGPPFRLTTLDQRLRLFAAAGADGTIVLPFGEALAGLSADQFVGEWLATRFGAAALVTGSDFTFGRNRMGDTTALARLAAAHGMATETVQPIADGAGPISSTRIRAALRAGDCDTATRLLTRPFAIEAQVVHGDKRGRELGYPTANMMLGDYLRPRYGIYAVRAQLADGRRLDGAANVGIRPQYDPPKELLEPFLFDFAEEIYGQTLSVELVSFIRPEARFASVDALITQMEADCGDARRRLHAAF